MHEKRITDFIMLRLILAASGEGFPKWSGLRSLARGIDETSFGIKAIWPSPAWRRPWPDKIGEEMGAA